MMAKEIKQIVKLKGNKRVMKQIKALKKEVLKLQKSLNNLRLDIK